MSSLLFEQQSRLRVFAKLAFEKCHSLTLMCIPSNLVSFNTSCFTRGSLGKLTFESPSRCESLSLTIPDGFGGDEIDVPDSVRQVAINVDSDFQGTVVVRFATTSHLYSFACRRTENGARDRDQDSVSDGEGLTEDDSDDENRWNSDDGPSEDPSSNDDYSSQDADFDIDDDIDAPAHPTRGIFGHFSVAILKLFRRTLDP
jgi:hypothetical protein